MDRRFSEVLLADVEEKGTCTTGLGDSNLGDFDGGIEAIGTVARELVAGLGDTGSEALVCWV